MRWREITWRDFLLMLPLAFCSASHSFPQGEGLLCWVGDGPESFFPNLFPFKSRDMENAVFLILCQTSQGSDSV